VFVVWKVGQARVVRRIVVAEDQGIVGALVVVTVHLSDNISLNLHQFAEVQARAICKIQIAANQSGTRRALVEHDVGGVHDWRRGDGIQ